MRSIVTTKAFRKDLKRMRKRSKDLSKLERVVKLLGNGEKLDKRFVLHPLTGDWKPHWDLHIEPDWVLIFRVTKTELFLTRTGSHSDLFN